MTRRAAAGEAAPTDEPVVNTDALEPGEHLTREQRRRLIADSLEKLAELGAFADIDDPVEWQREMRKDRPLPGRDP